MYVRSMHAWMNEWIIPLWSTPEGPVLEKD